jgi:hypothetical protein
VTLSNGNATATATASAGCVAGAQARMIGTAPWSFSVTIGGPDGIVLVGIGTPSAIAGGLFPGANNNGFGYYGNDGHRYNSTDSAYGATYGPGDVIGVKLAANGDLTFYKNGASQGVAYNLTSLGFSSTLTSFYPMFGGGTSSAGARSGTIDTSTVLGGAVAWG